MIEYQQIASALSDARRYEALESVRCLVAAANDARQLLDANDKHHFDHPIEVAGKDSAFVKSLRYSLGRVNESALKLEQPLVSR